MIGSKMDNDLNKKTEISIHYIPPLSAATHII